MAALSDIEFEQLDSKLHYLRTRQHNVDVGSKGALGLLRRYCCRPSCIPITVIAILIILVVLLPQINNTNVENASNLTCHDPCVVTLVESLPEGLYHPSHPSVYTSWMKLLDLAEERVDIASSYWSLRGSDVSNTTHYDAAWQGERVFDRLKQVGLAGKVKIRVVQSVPTSYQPDLDTKILERLGAAEVRDLNFTHLVSSGILHTKMWLVDSKHFYLGSANLDWRSLTQVKELGVVIYNCSCLARDMAKIFEVYWMLGKPGSTVPTTWPDSLHTGINESSPIRVTFNKTVPASDVFLSSSPPPLCPPGRTSDLDSVLYTLKRADKYMYIAVMDYVPTTLYTKHTLYWPVLDDVIREAAVSRRVRVKMLISWWKHSRPAMITYLKSLAQLGEIKGVSLEVRLYQVPPGTQEIPYTRVNHNKYAVTERTAYIGTSNWSADYFLWTGGIGFILEPEGCETGNLTTGRCGETYPDLRQQLEDVFLRDWNSNYSTHLPD